MRVLTFTSLFPNAQQPNKGIFIKQRMAAVKNFPGVEVRVVAPVPYFPDLPGPQHWRAHARVLRCEQIDGMETLHPRYLVIPGMAMSLHGVSMFLGALPTVRRLYREFPFDLIDAHYVYPDGQAALLLGRYFRKPVVVSARGTDINVFPDLPWVGGLVKRVVKKADRLIAVSGSLGDRMAELGASRERIQVIPNGIDPKRFFPMDRALARRSLGLVEKGKLLVSVGALIEGKGMHLLIEALASLKMQGRLDFHTCIVGKGKMRGQLEEVIASTGLGDQVTLVGEVAHDQLANWYNAADLFFLGSAREGWPNVVCESLACGTPVVATAVNGIPEIIDSDRLGIMVERTPDAFARGILEAINRQWDRSFILDRGSRRTWEAVAGEVHAVFAGLARLS